MPQGIIATDEGDGFVTLDFVDKELRGPALNTLVEIGGAETIETITRRGPRRQYKVPKGNAEEAGLLDGDTETRTRSAGQDTGAAQALADADPNAQDDGADWHTPTAEYTSANAFVGQVANEEVLDRPQVFTGEADSFGGSGDTRPHRDVIETVVENSTVRAVKGRQPATETDPVPLVPVSQINASLATQPGAHRDDPGARPDAGGQVVAEEYTSPQASRAESPQTGQTTESLGKVTSPFTGSAKTTAPDDEDVVEYPEGEPSKSWRRDELDAYALKVKSLDTSGLNSKDEVLAAIKGKKV